MDNGISIYPGLDNTLEENLQLIESAHRHGLKRIFTSLHIPETDIESMKQDIGTLRRKAKECDMEIISDISPATMELFGFKEFKLSALKMLGIGTLRLDYGFSLEEIAHFSRHPHGMRLQLNASTVTGHMLSALVELKTDFSVIDALHNFYPRVGTGLSEEALVRKNVMLHKLGIKVGAFVPSQKGKKRSPLREGLPTMEDHRPEPTDLAARHLVALGTDYVIISDALPAEEELAALGSLQGDRVTLSAKLLTRDEELHPFLAQPFTSRLDEARDAIRAQESRPRLKGLGIGVAPENTAERPIGAITLDNIDYGRYMGELQIIKGAQPADPRTNVVAMVDKDELGLLQYITPGRKFSFRFHP